MAAELLDCRRCSHCTAAQALRAPLRSTSTATWSAWGMCFFCSGPESPRAPHSPLCCAPPSTHTWYFWRRLMCVRGTLRLVDVQHGWLACTSRRIARIGYVCRSQHVRPTRCNDDSATNHNYVFPAPPSVCSQERQYLRPLGLTQDDPNDTFEPTECTLISMTTVPALCSDRGQDLSCFRNIGTADPSSCSSADLPSWSCHSRDDGNHQHQSSVWTGNDSNPEYCSQGTAQKVPKVASASRNSKQTRCVSGCTQKGEVGGGGLHSKGGDVRTDDVDRILLRLTDDYLFISHNKVVR